MKYKEEKPCAALQPYIHSFWELKGEDKDKQWERIFPDGCPGLVLNLGDTCITDNGKQTMDYGRTYVVGPMTSYKDNLIEANTHLVGVCLKPGVFASFFDNVPQAELTDKTILLGNSYSFSMDKLVRNPVQYLNGFFANRLQLKNPRLQTVLDHIHREKGQVSINNLAKKTFVTVRWLERTFKMQIGITPKEYANIIRFQHALSKLKNNCSGKTLVDIAFECGYYDHAHLTNEIKKNTGLAPSQL